MTVIVAIDHVQLAMPEGGEAPAQEFYEGLLGLTRVPKPPHLEQRGGCWFETERVKIHLGADADFRPARKAHPALLVDDLDRLIARLRQPVSRSAMTRLRRRIAGRMPLIRSATASSCSSPPNSRDPVGHPQRALAGLRSRRLARVLQKNMEKSMKIRDR